MLVSEQVAELAAVDGHHVAGTPYTYHHGWVLIGPAVPGEPVSHPDLGVGVISSSDVLHGKHTVNVDFDHGVKVQFEHTARAPRGLDIHAGLHRRVVPPETSPPIDIYALTEDQQAAVSDYISPEGSEAINGALRAGKMPAKQSDSYADFLSTPTDRAAEVRTLDKLIASYKTTKPVTVYRGMALSPALAKQLKPGAVFTDKGFTSTSDSLDWAQKFASLRTTGTGGEDMPGVKALGGKPVIMNIALPVGSHMGPGEPDIGEYVLPRGGSYHVDSVSPDGSTYQLSVAPSPAQSAAPHRRPPAVAAHLANDESSKDAARAARLAWAEDEIEVQPAPQRSAGLISGQVTELGWRYNPLEHRDEHGEWSKTGESVLKDGADYALPDHARLITKLGRPPDPADHPFFKAHPVSAASIVAKYDKTPDEFRQQGMRWYADAHTIAKALAGGDADKGAGVLAAYSPQTGWPANMMNAARSLELGRAIGPGEGMVTGAMQHNAQEAIDGMAADEANSSSKTKAFARLIRNGGDMPGDAQGDVVIDRHALSVAMGTVLPKSESDKAPIGQDRYYQHVADAYRAAARQISERDGTPVAPHQLQAITWLQQQAENESIDAAGGGGGTRGEQSGRLAKGRTTSMRNAWLKWDALAKAEQLPTHAGTTMLDATPLLISAQVIELGWREEPRDSKGRWTRFGGVGAAVGVMEKEREGFSVSPYSGTAPAGGYMVALDGHTHRYPAAILDDPAKLHRAIDDMLMSERESFQGKDMFLGGWVEDGKLWLDPSQNVQDRATAEQLGKARDQVGIFDLNTFSTINTGGSGGGRIIDHANQGPRGGPGELLGPAGGRAAGSGGGDRQGFAGGIAAQVIGLAGWRDAWRHELRGPHGEWVKSGQALTADSKPRVSFTGGRIRRGESWSTFDPDGSGSLVTVTAGSKPNTVLMKHADGSAEEIPARFVARPLGPNKLTGANETPPEIRSAALQQADTGKAAQKAVQKLLYNASDSLPGMFGSGEHLDWDGKGPTIFQDSTQPGMLASVDWNGHIEIASSVATGLRDDQADPSKPVADPSNYTVPLHELIHAVVPAGQSRETNGDMKAYQDFGTAQIEEGFTELGTIQHAGDFFDQLGVADRETPVHLTMGQLADSKNAPAAIRDGEAWGHYPRQTAQAFEWVSMIAQMKTGEGEDTQATQDAIQQISDEVNAAGAAAKITVMARHVARDISNDPGVLSSTEASIKETWGMGDVQAIYRHARDEANRKAAEIEAERSRAAA